MDTDQAYGLWPLVVVSSAIVVLFALSFFRPATRRDWKVMGTFTAFIVALFSEMYGVPLTIYLLSSWLGSRFPGLTLSHSSGHLWNDLLGWKGDPHASPLHVASYMLIIAGFCLIAAGWRVLWRAARNQELARTGPYVWVRHPQYAGFLVVMVAFLLQWPTILTIGMFPVLVVVYRRLAIAEEREVRERFGAAWDDYAALTPRFVPWCRRRFAAPRVAPPCPAEPTEVPCEPREPTEVPYVATPGVQSGPRGSA